MSADDLAIELAYWQQTVLRTVGVLVAVLLPAGTLVYVFLFKMMSFMQSRLGPMEAGPYGSMQLLAEVGKWIQKEDIVPWRADRRLFALAPYVVVALGVPHPAGRAVRPRRLVHRPRRRHLLGPGRVVDLGARHPHRRLGVGQQVLAARRPAGAGQLIAYELPMVLAVVGVVIQAGTLNLQGIVAAQHEGEIFGWGGIGNPYILTQFIGFFIFLVAMQAELTQTPFDMPIAESELVSGYMTEYSGMRFLLFFIAEFASAGAFAAVAATLFLGGWSTPGSTSTPTHERDRPGRAAGQDHVGGVPGVLGPVHHPRSREDQLQQLARKILIPLSLVNILATMALKVMF